MNGRLFLVTPPNVRAVSRNYEIDADFAKNLSTYLINFDHVTFACPQLSTQKDSGIIRSLPLCEINNHDRLSYIPLPYPYREDRYLRHYLATRKLLRSEIAKADYLLFAPHAMYDWPTLANLLAIKMKRDYGIDSDGDLESATRFSLQAMPFGFNKIRKTFWAYSLSRNVRKCLSNSRVALLQGQDVFDAYKDVAPNPQEVLNIQVSSEDHIPPALLKAKLTRIKERRTLKAAYAGRMVATKGPLDWLKAIGRACEAGVDLQATWYGDGTLMSKMLEEVERLGIRKIVTLVGVVSREEIMANLQKTDIFLFCHMIGESPRCLGEALAAGCSLVGYGTAYSRGLVRPHGGGEFANIGNWQGLAEILLSLDRDRSKLGRLVEAAAASGKLLDRDTAMQYRIEHIRRSIRPPERKGFFPQKSGLRSRCELDRNAYPKGIKVSDAEMATLKIKRDAFHPERNDDIAPMNENTEH
jgi:glycosyltransferase involved in cell wall biosynthesis